MGAVFEGAMALKCYSGEFENRGGRQREPRLRDCGRNDDMCLSYYAKTDLKFKLGYEIPAGSWEKQCIGRSSQQIEDFDGDFSERCIVSKKDLTSGTFIICICKTDGCNQ